MTDPAKTIVRRRPTQRLKDTPLTEQDWVDAAIKILVDENVRGIRIDALCKILGVTKGSFYWHFATRNDLLVAMLDHWRRRTTLNVIRSISGSGVDPRNQLKRLFALPRRRNSPASAQVENSIRDWSRRVALPRRAVEEVDEIRFDYITKLFEDLGCPEGEARKRAYLAYCLLMGDAILNGTIKTMSDDEFADFALGLTTTPAPATGDRD